MDSQQKKTQLTKIISKLLTAVGEDINRDGLIETPKRVARMYQELLSGYEIDSKKVFKLFQSEDFSGIVNIENIQFYSLCEHHLVPFFGTVSIGYLPNGKILGLSKFARLVEIYARRLQVQERFTIQIATDIMKYLAPKGVIVVSQAEHLCMSMRGIKKPGSITTVIVKKGIFEKDPNLVREFLLQIRAKESNADHKDD